MSFYIYSGVIPIAIIAVILWLQRPLNFQRTIKALTITIVPLVVYMSLVYFLQMGDYIDVGWVLYTLTFFFIPYLAIVLILNLVAWNKRRKA